MMDGYQQSILLLLGCEAGGKYLVRCIDRFYIDAVADLFPTSPYIQRRNGDGKDFWVLKSARVRYDISIPDVRDAVGFCRGVVELQGTLDLWRHRIRCGAYVRTPRLRIYGASDLLSFVSSFLPAAPKKIQHITTNNGSTCALYYQSPAEVADILDFLRGEPCNPRIWECWDSLLSANRSGGKAAD